MIDGHGDNLYRYSGKIHINFSTNIPQNVNQDLAHWVSPLWIFHPTSPPVTNASPLS